MIYGRATFSALGASAPTENREMEKIKVQRTSRTEQKEFLSKVRLLSFFCKNAPLKSGVQVSFAVRCSLLFEKAFDRTLDIYSLTHSLFGSMHSSRPTIHFAGFGGGCPALPSSSRFARAASSSRFRHSC